MMANHMWNCDLSEHFNGYLSVRKDAISGRVSKLKREAARSRFQELDEWMLEEKVGGYT